MNQNHKFEVTIEPRYKNVYFKKWKITNHLLDQNKIEFRINDSNLSSYYTLEKQDAIKLAKAILQYYEE